MPRKPTAAVIARAIRRTERKINDARDDLDEVKARVAAAEKADPPAKERPPKHTSKKRAKRDEDEDPDDDEEEDADDAEDEDEDEDDTLFG